MSIISPWYQLGYVIPHLYTDMERISSTASRPRA